MKALPSIAERFDRLPVAPLESTLRLRTGSIRDYEHLGEHHYRAAKPATVTRVLILEHEASSITDRFRRQATPTHLPSAVLVESFPPLSSALRNWAMHARYGPLRDMKVRAAALNREVRCISRVVVHPQWRGLGLAVRLVREALATATTPVTEAFAAMGHVNPFFERAGMTAHRRAPHAFDRRLIDAMAYVGLETTDLTMKTRVMDRIARMEPSQRDLITSELRRWHRQTVGRAARHACDLPTLVAAARDRLLLDPVYYVHVRS